MYLNKIDDPRDTLQRARQSDILRFARARDIKEISHDMPAVLARPIIRSKGLAGQFSSWARGNVQFTPLGQPSGPAITSDQANAVDAEADMARQFAQQKQQDTEPPLDGMGINELRKECQRLQIKLGRRDNMDSMRSKIEAERNGQNAA